MQGESFDFERFDRYVETALAHDVGPSISAYAMLVFRGPQRLSVGASPRGDR